MAREEFGKHCFNLSGIKYLVNCKIYYLGTRDKTCFLGLVCNIHEIFPAKLHVVQINRPA